MGDGRVLFKLGVIADAQYGDKDTKGHRDYRGSLAKLEQATAAIGRVEGICGVLHLGDLIEGHGSGERAQTREQQHAASAHDLQQIMAVLHAQPAAGPRPVWNVVGNHDHSLPRSELHAAFDPDRRSNPVHPAALYYDCELAEGWRLVVLDTTAVSTANGFRWPPAGPTGAELLEAADRYLAVHEGEDNAVDWNGGVGAAQLAWLAGVLARCAAAGERAVVCGHAPLLPEASDAWHVAWDWEEVVAVLDAQSGVVALYLSGHDHRGGYARSAAGVPHVTVAGMVEAPSGSNAYAVRE